MYYHHVANFLQHRTYCTMHKVQYEEQGTWYKEQGMLNFTRITELFPFNVKNQGVT